jgi:hypothetical protein
MGPLTRPGRDPPPQVGRTGSAGGASWAVLVVAAVLLAIAVLKPWLWLEGGPGTANPAGPPDASAPAGPLGASAPAGPARSDRSAALPGSSLPTGTTTPWSVPSSSPTGGAPQMGSPWSGPFADCPAPDSWRIATLGRWERWMVHSWAAVAPVRADDPRDPAIPAVPVYADSVLGLGFCAPWDGPLAPAMSATVELWWQPAGASQILRIPLDRLPNLGSLPGGPRGGLWGAPTVLRIDVPSTGVLPVAPTTVPFPPPTKGSSGPPSATPGATAVPPSIPPGSWFPGRYVFLVGGWAVGMEIELGRGHWTPAEDRTAASGTAVGGGG